MKDPGVCEGCRYHIQKNPIPYLTGTCTYSDVHGKSRVLIEERNGGYKTDSCICREPGKFVPTVVKPTIVPRGDKSCGY